MQIGDKYKVKIEKLTSDGQGLTHIDNFVIFVNNVCPEDFAEIAITKINKHFAIAETTEIIEPSQYRTKPFCPMQKICGACQIQYIDYEYQLKIKREIVEEVLQRIGNIKINVPLPIPSPQNKEYRHKIQYPISQTKNSKRILAGYYKQSSHEIVNIKYCPIQPEICDKIIEFIREEAPKFNVSGYTECSHSGDLRHVVMRHSNYNGKILLTLIINNKQITDNIINLANNLYNNFDEISGVCVNINTKKTNVIFGEETKCIVGKNFVEEQILDKTFIIGAETFFQINPASAENIFKYVKEYIIKNFKNPMILDAYAGISAFGICLSDCAKNVVTIEENKQSVELAKKTAKNNGIKNIEINDGDAEKFLSNEKRKFDIIILDPPRKGCTKKSLEHAMKLCQDTIIYVSCNPATLARDLKYLNENGFSTKSVQPFDMFCHTTHIENVAIIKKN